MCGERRRRRPPLRRAPAGRDGTDWESGAKRGRRRAVETEEQRTSEQSEGNIRYFYGTNMTLTGGPQIVYVVSSFFFEILFGIKLLTERTRWKIMLNTPFVQLN